MDDKMLLPIAHRREHDQQTQHQLCAVQTMAQTSLSWFLLPCNDSCSYCTMGHAEEQSTMVSHSCLLLVALPEAIGIEECICLKAIHR